MKEKNEISILRHELKNPLTICNGYLEMLLKSEDISKKEYLKIIKEEINRSLNILNNYSKNLEIEELDLSFLIEEIKDIYNPLLKKNNCEIIYKDEEEYYLEGDYQQLKQLFLNIIKNSYESKKNKKLKISINIKELSQNIEVTITDNGCGMSIEEQKNIFNDYYTTKKTGTGLGLSFIKETIKLQGGDITYKSKINKGTKAIITLPKKSPKTFNNSNYNYWNKQEIQDKIDKLDTLGRLDNILG